MEEHHHPDHPDRSPGEREEEGEMERVRAAKANGHDGAGDGDGDGDGDLSMWGPKHPLVRLMSQREREDSLKHGGENGSEASADRRKKRGRKRSKTLELLNATNGDGAMWPMPGVIVSRERRGSGAGSGLSESQG